MPNEDGEQTAQEQEDEKLERAYRLMFKEPIPMVYLRHLEDPRPAIREAIRTKTPIPSRLEPGQVT